MTNETTLPELPVAAYSNNYATYWTEAQMRAYAQQATADLRAELEQCRADAERFVAMIEAGISEDGGSPNACAKYLTTRRVAAYGSMPKTVDGWRKIIDAARGAA